MVSETFGKYKCIEGPCTNFSNFVNLPKGKITLWCQFITNLIIDNTNGPNACSKWSCNNWTSHMY